MDQSQELLLGHAIFATSQYSMTVTVILHIRLALSLATKDHTFGSPAGDRCLIRGEAKWIFCSGRSKWYFRASM